MIKRNYYKIVRIFPDPSSYFYIKNETMNEGWIDLFLFTPERLNEMTLDYSFDKVNWTRVTEYNNSNIYIPADGYMYLRNTTGVFGTDTQVFSPHFNISIGGDIRTLFNYTDVESVTKIPDYGFYYPFTMQENSKCIDISNLSFRGITEIGNYGLQNTFGSGFTGTKGVDLRDVTTLGEGALRELYSDNPYLTEVYAPNISTWDTNKTEWWLSNVAPTGVVYKPSTLTIPTDTNAGIPYGWTTQDYPVE